MKSFNICKFNQDIFPAERIASKGYWENKKSREFEEAEREQVQMFDDGYGDYLDAVFKAERDDLLTSM